MVRRTGHDIWADILELCKTPRTKTQVVYGTNLNFSIYKGYVRDLVDKGMLRVVGDKFLTTEEGARWQESATVMGIGTLAVAPENVF